MKENKKIIEEFLKEEGKRLFTVWQCWDVEEGADEIETEDFLEEFMDFLQKKDYCNQ